MQLKSSNINIETPVLFSFVVFCSAISSSTLDLFTFYVDEGKNLTLPCSTTQGPVMWVHEGRGGLDEVLPNGSLYLTNISVADAGKYSCYVTVTTEYDTVDESGQVVKSDNSTLMEISRNEVHVRTTPGPVSRFTCRATTIIAVIIWEVWPNRTGGHPLQYFTADMRRVPDFGENETEWQLLDPHHISPNARQLEVFHLSPNTTYEFRIWSTNKLGPGEKMTISTTTVRKTLEADLIRRLEIDAQDFDTRVWIVAVAVVMGSLVILSLGTCLVLYKECRESTGTEEDLDSVELVPNIILNPGFCDSDGDQRGPSPITVQTKYQTTGCNHLNTHRLSHSIGSDDEDMEEPMTFSRKMSIFFTGNTIKRI